MLIEESLLKALKVELLRGAGCCALEIVHR